jgi:nucleoid DNA-binding protein
MTKDELVAKVSELSGLKKADVQKTLDSMIETIVTTIKLGEKVNITNLGIFKIRIPNYPVNLSILFTGGK